MLFRDFAQVIFPYLLPQDYIYDDILKNMSVFTFFSKSDILYQTAKMQYHFYTMLYTGGIYHVSYLGENFPEQSHACGHRCL